MNESLGNDMTPRIYTGFFCRRHHEYYFIQGELEESGYNVSLLHNVCGFSWCADCHVRLGTVRINEDGKYEPDLLCPPNNEVRFYTTTGRPIRDSLLSDLMDVKRKDFKENHGVWRMSVDELLTIFSESDPDLESDSDLDIDIDFWL